MSGVILSAKSSYSGERLLRFPAGRGVQVQDLLQPEEPVREGVGRGGLCGKIKSPSCLYFILYILYTVYTLYCLYFILYTL